VRLARFLIVGLVAASVPTLAASQSNAQVSKVRVASMSEPANGLTKADMNAEFLQALKENWAESYRQSVPDKKIDFGLSFESRYVDYPAQRLAIIELRLNKVAVGASVFGIIGDNLVRVVCLDRVGDPIDLNSGECGQKIRDVFGVTVSGQGAERG
jgi:hypothetical protein